MIRPARTTGATEISFSRILYAASDVTNNPSAQNGSANKPFGTLAQARAAALLLADADNWINIEAIGDFTEAFAAAQYVRLAGKGPNTTRIIPPALGLVEVGVGNFHMEDLSIEPAGSNAHWLLHTRLGASSKTCTFTLDNSSITCTSHGFSADDQIYFTTTDSLPTNINAGTWYRVIYIDANHFRVSLTSSTDPLGVVPITPTSGQAGAHTAIKDTLVTVDTWLPNIVFNNIRVSNANGIAIGTITARTYGLVVEDAITGISRNIGAQHHHHRIRAEKYGVKDSFGLSENLSQTERAAFKPIFHHGEITIFDTVDGWAIRGLREDENGEPHYDQIEASWIPTLIDGGVVNGGTVLDGEDGSTAPAMLGMVEGDGVYFKADLHTTDRVFGENATNFPSCAARLNGCTFDGANNRVDECIIIGNSVISGGSAVIPQNVFAKAKLQGTKVAPNDSTNVADGDIVQISTITYGVAAAFVSYRFKTTPSQAYDVKRGASFFEAFSNLKAAINLSGNSGGEYFAGTLIHPDVTATHIANRATDISLTVKAKVVGKNGVNILTPSPSPGANIAWDNSTLTMRGVAIAGDSVISHLEFESDPTNICDPPSHRRLKGCVSALGQIDIGFKAPRRGLLCRTKDQYAELSLGVHTDLRATRTVEMWVKIPSWAYAQQIGDTNYENIGLIGAVSGAREFYLVAQRLSSANVETAASRILYGGFEGGTVQYQASDNEFLNGSTGIFGDGYTHLAVVLTVTTQQLWINGVAKGSTDVGALINANTRWTIGGFADSTVNGAGSTYRANAIIRAVRLSSTARTFDPAAMEKRFSVDANTIALWDGDHTGETSWPDRVSGRNDLTFRGPPLWVPEDFTL